MSRFTVELIKWGHSGAVDRAITSWGLNGSVDRTILSGATVGKWIEPLRVKRGEYGAAQECNGGGKREIPDKNPPRGGIGVTPPGIEPGSLWSEASSLTTTPPRPLRDCRRTGAEKG
ncbi:hypothetical protein PR048_007246 [Dryococelus australis]|uniref:Uncharacterized protein n=1 Tax=Dryococelus australis TaxID=614101 RepID=A0ABQ9ID35_9NEOP|nr:hypothetical protein PR048_007246 [Dryococelus australis]